MRQQRTAAYKAELNHLLALRERLSIAVEACKRRQQVLVCRITIQPDGTVSDTRDVWLEPEKFRRLMHAAQRESELHQSESAEQEELDAENFGDTSNLFVQNLPESITATHPAIGDINLDAEDEDHAAFTRWFAQFEPRRRG